MLEVSQQFTTFHSIYSDPLLLSLHPLAESFLKFSFFITCPEYLKRLSKVDQFGSFFLGGGSLVEPVLLCSAEFAQDLIRRA